MSTQAPPPAPATALTEDVVVRFIASIGPMRRLGRDIAGRVTLVEINEQDPLMPYALLSPLQLAQEAGLPRLLSTLGFESVRQWLAAGSAILEAHYALEAQERGQQWRQQLIGIVARIRGIDREPPGRQAELLAGLRAELGARGENSDDGHVPKAHLDLARKYRHSLELAIQFD